MQLKNQVLVIVVLCLVLACNSKKKQLLDSDEVTNADFIEFFEEIKLPVHLADTMLQAKTADSLRIGNKILSQFVPDSIFHGAFGKKTKPQVFPIGKSTVKDAETYLLVKAALGSKRAAYVLVFVEDSFRVALPLITSSAPVSGKEQMLANIDSRYTITVLKQRISTDGQILYQKNVYVYNTEGVFTLILTESNDQEAANSKILNPIDTLPSTHKLTGDYRIGTRNIVSFRDGHRQGTMMLFVHFEKDNRTCFGELKGEVKITGSNSARYIENDGPCVIDFKFAGNTVTMKEQEGCGSYRDIKCFFEGSYTKKKKPAAATKKKK